MNEKVHEERYELKIFKKVEVFQGDKYHDDCCKVSYILKEVYPGTDYGDVIEEADTLKELLKKVME